MFKTSSEGSISNFLCDSCGIKFFYATEKEFYYDTSCWIDVKWPMINMVGVNSVWCCTWCYMNHMQPDKAHYVMMLFCHLADFKILWIYVGFHILGGYGDMSTLNRVTIMKYWCGWG